MIEFVRALIIDFFISLKARTGSTACLHIPPMTVFSAPFKD